LKKILLLLFPALILSGCATYKFQKSSSQGSTGFLVSYDGKNIPEYTVGKNNSLPDLKLACRRFVRRQQTVEYYYKKTGQIESRLKEFLWDPPAMFADFVGGLLRWPFVARADYKYNHDPAYKAKVDKQDEEKDRAEAERISNLKKELAAYIARDLAEESGGKGVVENALAQVPREPAAMGPASADKGAPSEDLMTHPVESVAAVPPPVPAGETQLPSAPHPAAPAEIPAVKQDVLPEKMTNESAVSPVKTESQVVVLPPESPYGPVPEKKELKPEVSKAAASRETVSPVVAVITAEPAKGYSPLTVKFSGKKSFSRSGRIVSYHWDFGDGDVSDKKNTENTYLSTTFGAREFTATLTVKDQAGSVASVTSVIEVNTH
jgi:hypothetical protein